jgi:hypothetical protein
VGSGVRGVRSLGAKLAQSSLSSPIFGCSLNTTIVSCAILPSTEDCEVVDVAGCVAEVYGEKFFPLSLVVKRSTPHT